MAIQESTYREYMKHLKKVKLLTLGEWLLYPLVEAGNKVASAIFCSLSMTSASGIRICMIPLWQTPAATRIICNAYTIQLEGESMCKRMGMTG